MQILTKLRTTLPQVYLLRLPRKFDRALMNVPGASRTLLKNRYLADVASIYKVMP